MKMTVITGRGGKIIGTARHGEAGPAAGRGGPIAGPGQSAHVIDLPSALEKVESSEDLYRELKRLIPSGSKKSKSASPSRKKK